MGLFINVACFVFGQALKIYCSIVLFVTIFATNRTRIWDNTHLRTVRTNDRRESELKMVLRSRSKRLGVIQTRNQVY
ncbi:hypothetical protein BKA82DRAFT_4048180, partial [Pisolithus tinctorius]